MRVGRRRHQMSRCLLLLALLGARGDDDVDCKGMKGKQLRQWLAARALKCDGCAEKADFVALCEANRDAPLATPSPAADSDGPRVRTPGQEKDADINELLKSMKGMPGMENIKVMTPDDILKSTKDDFMRPPPSGGRPAGKRERPKRDAKRGGGGGGDDEIGALGRPVSSWREELVDFYTKYEILARLDGVDEALAKWRGREDEMMAAVKKKYKYIVDEESHKTEL